MKTVPRIGEQPPRTTASTSIAGAAVVRDEIVVRPKERQVCALLRNLLKRDREATD